MSGRTERRVFLFSVKDWKGICKKRGVSSFLKFSTSSQNAEFNIYRSQVKVGLSKVIKFCSRKL